MSLDYKLVTSLHRGNYGAKTGSSPRPGGKTHLWDQTTGRAVCGIPKGSMYIHSLTFTLDELPIRYPMCQTCMTKVNG